MSIVIDIEELREYIRLALSVRPSNNKNTIQCEHFKNHSGYVPWCIINFYSDDFRPLVGSTNYGKSSIVVEYESLDNNYNCENCDDKIECLKYIHNKVQERIGKIIKKLVKIIRENPNKYQAEIARCAGLTRNMYDDNDWIIATFLGIAVEQGIIEKYKKNNHVYFVVVNDKPYEPIEYIDASIGASKQEAELANYLIKKGIPFVQQKTFEWCKNKKRLPYDFQISTEKGEILVEIQGEQHHKFIPFFHKNQENFFEQLRRDKIKRISAEENGMKLLHINYYENVVVTYEKLHKRNGLNFNYFQIRADDWNKWIIIIIVMIIDLSNAT